MNYLKDNTVGIDTCIKGFQKHLYNGITKAWCLDKFDGYGRVYKNKRDDMVFPEFYVGKRDYKEVLLDDKRNGIMFFSPNNTGKVNDYLTIQKCDIMFSFDLISLGISDERQDEELRSQIITLLNEYSKEEKQIVTGLKEVYNDFNGVSKYFYDMQDFHHFKITLDLIYNNNNCKN